MKYKIIIDATTIRNSVDGLSQYIIGLINNLPEDSFYLFDYTILINPGVKREELNSALQSNKFRILVKKISPIGPKRDWDMFWFLLKNKNKFDLFHSTSNQYPLFLKKGIATIHDIIFLNYFDAPWWTFNFARHYMSFVIKKSLSNSAAVIAVSGATKNELIKSYKLNKPGKIQVIHEGWEHLSSMSDKNDVQPSNLINASYLFYVGSGRVHKNLIGLIKGFILALNKLANNINLVISGNMQHISKEIKILIDIANKDSKRIIFTGFISNELLKTTFIKADAFIFPSLNEGFGIPILESFYFKKPLLCSNIPCFTEIAGNAALYFDPTKPEEIAKTMLLFYDNPVTWASLIEKGHERLKLFSWKKTSVETVAVYTKILLN